MQDSYISINSQSAEELGRLVKQIDPELEYIKDLHPDGSTCRTFLVRHQNAERILKVRAQTSNVWDNTYFYYEIHTLRRVAEKKLSNVTVLIAEYESERYHAILKSYAEGTPCNTLDHEKLLKDKEFIKKLDALYLMLHLAGIAKINFLPRKIVIGADDELTLVDLSTCIVYAESGVSMFSQEMRADSRFITKLEKAAA